MKRASILLGLILAVPSLRARAEDSPPLVYHLDFIHYNADTRSLEWEVSQGVMTEEGEYVPQGDPTRYSVDMSTGVMSHNGEQDALDPENAYDTAIVLQALSRLVANHTDGWNASHGEDPAAGSKDSSKPSPTDPEQAAPPPPVHTGAKPTHHNPSRDSVARKQLQGQPAAGPADEPMVVLAAR